MGGGCAARLVRLAVAPRTCPSDAASAGARMPAGTRLASIQCRFGGWAPPAPGTWTWERRVPAAPAPNRRHRSGLPHGRRAEMIPSVTKLKLTCLAVTACLAACSGERATSSPAEEPEGAELELETEETEPAEEESVEAEPSEEESAEEESAEAEPPKDPPPAKKSCAELGESTCKVTVGCVWSTDKKCLDEG